MFGVNTQCNAEIAVRKQICYTHVKNNNQMNACELVCVLSHMQLTHINNAKPAQTKWE